MLQASVSREKRVIRNSHLVVGTAEAVDQVLRRQ